jgi:hypothetical protein
MKTVGKMLDSVLLALVSRRLARFTRRSDFADRFADGLMAALSAEMERRNRLLAGWDAERTEAERTAAECARRAAAEKQFQSFEPGENRLRLQ